MRRHNGDGEQRKSLSRKKERKYFDTVTIIIAMIVTAYIFTSLAFIVVKGVPFLPYAFQNEGGAFCGKAQRDDIADFHGDLSRIGAFFRLCADAYKSAAKEILRYGDRIASVAAQYHAGAESHAHVRIRAGQVSQRSWFSRDLFRERYRHGSSYD